LRLKLTLTIEFSHTARRMAKMTDDVSGSGVVYIGDLPVGDVFYWLTIDSQPGPVVAEGSISGPEALMDRIRSAQQVKLQLDDGPVFPLVPFGTGAGTNWVRLLKS
jgi:hypothetical protein